MKTIIGVVVNKVMDVVLEINKKIEEETVFINQIMKDQVKIHIPPDDMEDNIIQGKKKRGMYEQI